MKLMELPSEVQEFEDMVNGTDRAYTAYIETLKFRIEAGLVWAGQYSCTALMGSSQLALMDGSVDDPTVATPPVLKAEGEVEVATEAAAAETKAGAGNPALATPGAEVAAATAAVAAGVGVNGRRACRSCRRLRTCCQQGTS